jgi:hypothetical protein
MKYTFTENAITITCTFADLVLMDSQTQVIWATPNAEGEAQELYVSARPQWRDDFVVAEVDDFCQAVGWTSLGWEEMTDEELADLYFERITITVPRKA